MKYPNEELFYKQFGKHIKELRKKHNLTQRDLADRSDLEESAVQRIERGCNSTIKTLLKLANAFDIELSALFDMSLDDDNK